MSEVSLTRVMIVDDHEMIRYALTLALMAYEDFQLVGEAANGIEAIQRCPELQPDVILMDVWMPELDGVAATAFIRQRYPQVKIIALASLEDEPLAEAMLQAGANHYLLKTVDVDELAAAIRALGPR